jgi:hypothetical protein
MAKNEEVAEIQSAANGASTPVDTVLAVSRHADGTPAQTDGFRSVDPDATKAISEQQLRELHVSAVDHEIRSAAAGDAEPVEDPVNKALREAHEAAASAGEKRAQSESYQK